MLLVPVFEPGGGVIKADVNISDPEVLILTESFEFIMRAKDLF